MTSLLTRIPRRVRLMVLAPLTAIGLAALPGCTNKVCVAGYGCTEVELEEVHAGSDAERETAQESGAALQEIHGSAEAWAKLPPEVRAGLEAEGYTAATMPCILQGRTEAVGYPSTWSLRVQYILERENFFGGWDIVNASPAGVLFTGGNRPARLFTYASQAGKYRLTGYTWRAGFNTIPTAVTELQFNPG